MEAGGLGDAAEAGVLGGGVGRRGWRVGTGRAADGRPPREALLLLRNYEESGQGGFWSTDVDGRLTYISEAVAQLMGRGGLLGTAFTELFLAADGQDERQRSLPFLPMRQSRFDKLPLREIGRAHV